MSSSCVAAKLFAEARDCGSTLGLSDLAQLFSDATGCDVRMETLAPLCGRAPTDVIYITLGLFSISERGRQGSGSKIPNRAESPLPARLWCVSVPLAFSSSSRGNTSACDRNHSCFAAAAAESPSSPGSSSFALRRSIISAGIPWRIKLYWSAAAQYEEVIRGLMTNVANGSRRPEWKSDSFFRRYSEKPDRY